MFSQFLGNVGLVLFQQRRQFVDTARVQFVQLDVGVQRAVDVHCDDAGVESRNFQLGVFDVLKDFSFRSAAENNLVALGADFFWHNVLAGNQTAHGHTIEAF